MPNIECIKCVYFICCPCFHLNGSGWCNTYSRQKEGEYMDKPQTKQSKEETKGGDPTHLAAMR